MGDIVERLQEYAGEWQFRVGTNAPVRQAIDEILRLRSDIARIREENERLRTAIAPFAKLMPDTTWVNGICCKDYEDSRPFIVVDPITVFDFTMGDIRRARAALKHEEQKG